MPSIGDTPPADANPGRGADELNDLRERLARAELVNQIANVIHATLDSDEALQLILREAVRVTRASSGSIALIHPTTGLLEIQAAHGLPEDAHSLRLPVGQIGRAHV